MSKASRRYHDRVAHTYDQTYDDPFWRFHDELVWDAIKPLVPRDLSLPCIDLGCGTGKWGLKLLKSGMRVTFLDHSAQMLDRARVNAADVVSDAEKCQFVLSDIVDMTSVPSGTYQLALAMGDPLSICSSARDAIADTHRILRPGGVFYATVDHVPAAIDHYFEKGDMPGLMNLLRDGRSRWLTHKREEQFELRMFSLPEIEEIFTRAGFEVIAAYGRTILPIRRHADLLADPATRIELLRWEHRLCTRRDLMGRASHLHLVARKPG